VDGRLLWITQVDSHPAAQVTANPVVVGNRVIVGVASKEATRLRASTRGTPPASTSRSVRPGARRSRARTSTSAAPGLTCCWSGAPKAVCGSWSESDRRVASTGRLTPTTETSSGARSSGPNSTGRSRMGNRVRPLPGLRSACRPIRLALFARRPDSDVSRRLLGRPRPTNRQVRLAGSHPGRGGRARPRKRGQRRRLRRRHGPNGQQHVRPGCGDRPDPVELRQRREFLAPGAARRASPTTTEFSVTPVVSICEAPGFRRCDAVARSSVVWPRW
jgi:hypothetical protein